MSQKWDKRVGQWHDHVNSAAAFGKVLDRILVLSQPQPSDVCVDLESRHRVRHDSPGPAGGLGARRRHLARDDRGPCRACGRCRARERIDRGNQPEGFPASSVPRQPHRQQLRATPPGQCRQAGGDRACGAVAVSRRPPSHRRHDVRPRRDPARPCHLAPESGRARRQGNRRMVAHREEPDPLRPPRRAGAPGNARVLAASAARCGTDRGLLPSGCRRSRHRLRRPPALSRAGPAPGNRLPEPGQRMEPARSAASPG